MTTTTQAGTEVKLETLLPWGAAKRVATRNGDRNLRTAPATEAFWKQWRENKAVLQAAGISVSKGKDGAWAACWWHPLDAAVAKAEQEKKAVLVEASKAHDATIEIPVPAGLAYLPYQRGGICYVLEKFGFDFTKSQGNSGTRKGKQNYAVRNVYQNAGNESEASRVLEYGENKSGAGESSEDFKDERAGTGVAGDGCGTNKGRDAQAGCAPKAPIGTGKGFSERDELQRRERSGASPESQGTGFEAGTDGIHTGVASANEGARHSAQATTKLQSGLRPPDTQGSGGGGRPMPPFDKHSLEGRKENSGAESVGMDGGAGETLTKKGNCPSLGALIADEMGL